LLLSVALFRFFSRLASCCSVIPVVSIVFFLPPPCSLPCRLWRSLVVSP
jgi:hypothetical protein